jgi:hypothetical protein
MYRYTIAALAILVIGGVAYLKLCPCVLLPGLWLAGEEVASPVEDWSFVNETGLCQVEVSSWRPHSVNLNCMSEGSELFISCSNCAEKSWSHTAIENPYGRIRIDGRVYPVHFKRILEPDELDTSWFAKERKLSRNSGDRPDHWWSFHLTSIELHRSE